MRNFFVFLLLLPGLASFAQPGPGKTSISGTVVDASSGKPVDYATISIFTDSSALPVNGGVSNETGVFSISDLPAGTYRVMIDFINYRRDTISGIVAGNEPVDLGIIRLKSMSRKLSGVTVTANAPLVENKIDRIVYNAANDLTSQGSTALDMLRKVPQVTVDIDGNVELQGNANIRFLINGKPSSVFGSSLSDALAAIPSSQIQRIEAITTPGAKYDAQGTGGIINIILKESKIHGYNGSVNLSAGTRSENGSLNLNMRRGSFGLNAFFSGNALRTSHTPNSQDRNSIDTTTHTSTQLLQKGYNDFDRSGYQGGMGFDWSLSKRDNLNGGISYNHFGNHSVGHISQESVTRDPTGMQLSDLSGYRNSDAHFENNSIDWNLNYKRTFRKEGQELNLLYSASHGRPESNYTQSQTNAGELAPFTGSASHNPNSDMLTEISVDYSHPVSEKVMFETGLKTQLQRFNSEADVSTLQAGNNRYVSDPGQSYHLLYKMNVYAAYVSASFPLFHFLDVKAGARYEYTDVRIDYPNTSIPAYGLVVPTFILSHKFQGNQTLKLAYTRRIERAESRELNPFIDRSDPYNLTTGNPELKPEIGNNLELGYSRNFEKTGSLNISLIERINTQDHKRIVDFYPEYQAGDSIYRNVSVQSFQNAGTEYNSGINVSGSVSIKEKLNLRGNAMLFHQYFVPGLAVLGTEASSIGMRFRINLNLSYQFAHNFSAEAFGNYSSASHNIQGRAPQWFIYTLALRKQFWDKKASIGLTATNPFNEYVQQVNTISTSIYSSYTERLIPLRSFGLSFTWKFGKLEFKKDGEEDKGDMGGSQGGGS